MPSPAARLNVARFLALACAIAACATAPARAADARPFPDRPVRIVAGQQAGSATDNVARTIADALAEHWGVAVVVENRPGAGGTIGAEAVAGRPPTVTRCSWGA